MAVSRFKVMQYNDLCNISNQSLRLCESLRLCVKFWAN
jgi:hypothetical protein